MMLILQLVIRIHVSAWDLAAKNGGFLPKGQHTLHTFHTVQRHTLHTLHTARGIHYIRCIQACGILSGNSYGRCGQPPAFDCQRATDFSRRGGGESQETPIPLPHVACFSKLESGAIGRRSHWQVIRESEMHATDLHGYHESVESMYRSGERPAEKVGKADSPRTEVREK